MTSIVRALLIPVVTTAVLCGASREAAAQQMSYSVYTDASSTEYLDYIYGYSTLHDYSGCATNTTPNSVEIASPTRYNTVYSSNEVTLAWNNEEGNWAIMPTYSFPCNCAPEGGSHEYMPAGSLYPLFYITETFYKNPTNMGLWCSYSQSACSSGTPTCFGGIGIGMPSVGCHSYLKAYWLNMLTVIGHSCVVSVNGPWTGEGPCT